MSTNIALPGNADVATAGRAPQAGALTPPLIALPAPGSFVAKVDNPYLPFLPGSRWVYRGGTPEERERIVVTVLDRTAD